MEYERIREEIINQYIDDISQAVNISPSLSILRRYGIKFADQILSIKGLEIRAGNQPKPAHPDIFHSIGCPELRATFLYHLDKTTKSMCEEAYNLGQNDMLTPKDGYVWVKCKVKEE